MREKKLKQVRQRDRSGHGKAVYGSSETSLAGEKKVRAMRVAKAAVWVVVVVVAVAMGLLVGAFLIVAVKKAVVLVAVVGVLVLVLVAVTWNCVWGRRGLLGFERGYPDAELRGAIDGQYVKVTGVIDQDDIKTLKGRKLIASQFEEMPTDRFVESRT